MANFKDHKNKKESISDHDRQLIGETFHRHAVRYHTQGDLENAENNYRKAIMVGCLNQASFLNLGVICKDNGRPEEAITLIKKAIEINPYYCIAHLNLGGIYKDLGELDEALKYTLKSLELNPHNSDTHMNLGGIYQDIGNLDKALSSTLKSLALKPDNANALINLGGIYKKLGNLDKALAATLQSLELEPNNPDVLFNLGSIHRDLGNLDEALAATLLSLEFKPDNHNALINLGAIYKNLGNLDQALASTLKSLELDPKSPNALINLGSIYKDLGNLDEALAATLGSLELNPNNPTALQNLCIIYKNLGDLDKALVSALQTLKLKPDNPDAHINLGDIYNELNETSKAIYHLKEAKKSNKTRAEASIRLADIYYYTGKYRDGIKAVHSIPDSEALNQLLCLYLCLNDKTKFNQHANYLTRKKQLNQQGIAAVDHANILYNQSLSNTLSGSTLDSILIQTIDENEFSNSLMNQALIHILSGVLQAKSQGHLTNGLQTSGNILESPEKPFKALRQLLIRKIDAYNQSYNVNTDKDFKDNFQTNQYYLRGWAIIMNKGGSLKSHNHEKGWLTGTFYLQMPEVTSNSNSREGAIEFSHQGPNYPAGTTSFTKKIIRPSARDLNIFSSSLFHKTLPFYANKQRICIAFDVTQKKTSKNIKIR